MSLLYYRVDYRVYMKVFSLYLFKLISRYTESPCPPQPPILTTRSIP